MEINENEYLKDRDHMGMGDFINKYAHNPNSDWRMFLPEDAKEIFEFLAFGKPLSQYWIEVFKTFKSCGNGEYTFNVPPRQITDEVFFREYAQFIARNISGGPIENIESWQKAGGAQGTGWEAI